MMWHRTVTDKLHASDLFSAVTLVGAKIRASIDDVRFLDIYFDATSHSYSYALIDLRLPYPGDKRLIGWDDYPHEGAEQLRQLASHPHHFQRRAKDGSWIFEDSPMRGEIEQEIELVISAIKDHLQR
ncbi:MAG: hypothetical protein GY759_02075 [Chloroflexi bacterium]|nr:hypothetical protein [Chloroflexota bacterium]